MLSCSRNDEIETALFTVVYLRHNGVSEDIMLGTESALVFIS